MQALKRKNAPNRREKRRKAILEAARQVFLRQGYGATSLNDIVGVSGGSLATLYDLFGGKAGLFQAMVEEECGNFFGHLDFDTLEGKEPPEALREIATLFLEGVLQQPKMSLLRVIVAEVPQFPEVGTIFYRAGPGLGHEIVADYLRTQSALGKLRIDDPMRAARTFIALVLGPFHMKVLCGEEIDLTPEEIEQHLDFTLSAFFRLYEPAVG